MTLEDMERYHLAQHAMQTGVSIMMALNDPGKNVNAFVSGIGDVPGAEKHLRVGINSSMVDNTALAKILMAKGIFTRDEYEKYLADEMESEVERYRQRIKEKTGLSMI